MPGIGSEIRSQKDRRWTRATPCKFWHKIDIVTQRADTNLGSTGIQGTTNSNKEKDLNI